MKTEELRSGLKVKSYKALCELLSEPVKAGNSKKAQLKEFLRYFSYERDGHAYIIGEIYETPQGSKDGRQRYVNLIEPILMNYLSQKHDAHGVTWTKWYKELGMVNAWFYDEEYREETRALWRAKSYTLYLLTNMASRKNREILKSSLKYLEKRNMITCVEAWYIVDRYGFGHEARDAEVALLEKVRNTILHELGCTSMQQVFLSPKRYKAYDEKFHEKISSGLWRNAFQTLRVEPVGNAADAYKDINVEPMKKQLNSAVCSAVLKMATNAWEREGDKMLEMWGSEDSDSLESDVKKSFSLPECFSWDAEFLIDKLMRL